MQIQGLLSEVDIDGYERMLHIQTANGMLYCSALEPDEYLEPNARSPKFQVGEPLSLDLMLNLAYLETRPMRGAHSIFQEIEKSPHAVVVGTVSSIHGNDACMLALAGGTTLLVEFEMPVQLAIGDAIQASGELKVIDD